MSYLLKTYDNTMYNDLCGLIRDSVVDDKNKATENMERLIITLPRFKIFNLVYDADKPIACGGAYVSDFDSKFAFVGVRSYVLPEYKNLLIARNYILTAHKKWAIENGMKAIGLSVNEYNKNIINLWKTPRIGRNKLIRKAQHLFYLNFNEVPFPVNIRETKQYVAYENLDSWEYDWNKLRWQDS
jgi:hypothetical protein